MRVDVGWTRDEFEWVEAVCLQGLRWVDGISIFIEKEEFKKKR